MDERIAAEFRRYEKARTLCSRYTIAMRELDLQPLSSREIEDCWRELQYMAKQADRA